ncbi:hypothetical protein GCM10010124_14690 [Pilimelia terevasa]|uniref:Uncharacterized protein n=1 Tax=Pilimelia terevasa TaxID=53372 RepID=A0A8J3FHZ7_9ACTN|nr:hypothetical protein [Pilimelia terevasa]GGK23254.1 hypothetical protein GCM10010124_14690 [Pilimelia terevasa]
MRTDGSPARVRAGSAARAPHPAGSRRAPAATRPAPAAAGAPRRGPAGPAAGALLPLHRAAGNAAVAALVAQRATAAPAVPPPGLAPAQDPRFAAAAARVRQAAGATRAHPAPAREVRAAQAAAVPPPDHREAQAEAAHTGRMDAAAPGVFDKAAFVAAVTAAIAARAPQTLEQADDFAGSGRPEEVRTAVAGTVATGHQRAARDIADRTAAAPDPAAARDKPVTALPPAPATPRPAPPTARDAAPKPAPAAQVRTGAGRAESDAAMRAAGVSEDQLARSHEPEFAAAVAARQEGRRHDAAAPAALRAREAATLAGATAAAGAAARAGVAGMAAAKTAATGRAAAGKAATKARDEAERARISTEIRAIFDTTRKDVEQLLADLDAGVAARFAEGEARCRAAFTADHRERMADYKRRRYGGWAGGLRWAKDKLVGMPAEANEIFAGSRRRYEAGMQEMISSIADHVGAGLARAKARIAAGRAQVARHVAEQPAHLRRIAGTAAAALADEFAALESAVDEKRAALVDDLAAQYVEARAAVDAEITAMQAENQGLWDRAREAVAGAVQTVLRLKDMLLGVLSRAADAVGLIIRDPIGFLGNLVHAVRGGIVNFAANIVDHLKTGLKAWLFGNLAAAGVALPDTLDARGILTLVLSVLGLTWANVRARILRHLPERVLTALESTLDVVRVLVTEGLPGLWALVVARLGDLKELVLGQIREFVVERIVKAGIVWLISLLNPAAAFVKACQAIYQIVMFFVEKAAQVKEFVDSVLDSVTAIARGGAGAVAGLVERSLAKALPTVLGMLASLLGLGGISDKIKSVLEKVQRPVNSVIDAVVGTVVKAGRGLLRGGALGRAGQWGRGQLDRGRRAAAGARDAAVRGARRAVDWLRLRTSFTAADGSGHALYWRGRGAAAALTVASGTPTVVAALLRGIAPKIRAAHPGLVGALAAAEANERAVQAEKAVVEQAGPAGRDPRAVDRLNAAMTAQATLLAPLIPVAYPALPPTASGFPAWVQPGHLVKRGPAVAIVQRLDPGTGGRGPLAHYLLVNPRTRFSSPWVPPSGATGRGADSPSVVTRDWQPKPATEARPYYMGPNPRRTDPIYQDVVNRMTGEGKIVNGQVRYARSPLGVPLPAGQAHLYPLSVCAMGHIIDAVTWWNSNGRFTGPQSAEVRAFMTNPINYELEPGSVNSLRGATLGQTYEPCPPGVP